MKDRNSKNFSFPAQLGIFLFLTGIGMVLASFITQFVWQYSTGLPVLSMPSEMKNPQFYGTIMAIQALSTFFIFFLPTIFFSIICYKKSSSFLGSAIPVSPRQIILIAGILILVFPLGGALAEVNQLIPIPSKWAATFTQMEENRKQMEDAFINIDSFSKYLASLFVMAVLPGIFEEFFFRGGIQNLLTRWLKSPATAILITAFIFSAIHISYYGFLVRFSLGVVLGYIFYYSGSIWLPVLFHFLFNGAQVTALYLLHGSDKINTTDIEKNFPIWMGLIALVLLVLLFKFFREESVRIRQKFVYNDPGDTDIHDWIAKH